MFLKGKEIKDLAEYAGFTVEPLGEMDEDVLEQEFSIDEGPSKGVLEDDGTVNHYNYVVTCDGCDGNECSPLGDAINS